jgi:CheY-like chemotaxis protein
MAGAKRILVVDDEKDTQGLLCRILEGAGYVVDFAGDGLEALGKIHLDPPDLVLLDLLMPVVDGWQVLAALKRIPHPPPVIVVSAVSAREQALQEGAAAFLLKPFEFKALLDLCARALVPPPSSVR